MLLSERFDEIARAVNNWGRWGDDDRIGTLNLLTPDAVRRGVEAVVDGRSFPLAVPLSEDGVQAGMVPGRDNPVHELFAVNKPITGDPQAFATSDDRLTMALQAATHWDGLAHVTHSGRLYNGHDPSTVTASGSTALGIEHLGAVIGRGVLLDIPTALGQERLEPGHVVTPDDLDAAVEHAGLTVESGDLVLLRTGQMQDIHAGDRVAYAFPTAGPGMDAARWFHAHDVAAVATDNLAFEAFPCEDDVLLPVHLLHLVEMGMTQGQNFDLEELAAACAADGRYSCLLSATPEPVVGAVSGLVAPVAVR